MSKATKQPMPAGGAADVQSWVPPKSDQEFKFSSVDEAPAWIDKGWAGYDSGPALQVPAGDLWGTGPYHTKTVRVGDTVKFIAATASKPAHFEVIKGEPAPEDSTLKPPQASSVALEDALKSGVMTPDDLGPDAAAQVAGRTPALAAMIETGEGAPKAVPVSDLVKVD